MTRETQSDPSPDTLSIISYNIQAAIGAAAPSHYLTRIHRQFLHVAQKDANLARVGKVIEPFDIACLQEIDLGGRRAGFRNQVDELFRHTSYTDAAYQENRTVGQISRHGNVIFTRREMDAVQDLKLPARMGGRGALVGGFPLDGGRDDFLTVVNLHLSLGKAEQGVQLDALADELSDHSHIVLCGDYNTPSAEPHMARLMDALNLRKALRPGTPTYPSWGPRQALDHVLVSRHLQVTSARVLPVLASDHRPVAVDIVVPDPA